MKTAAEILNKIAITDQLNIIMKFIRMEDDDWYTFIGRLEAMRAAWKNTNDIHRAIASVDFPSQLKREGNARM